MGTICGTELALERVSRAKGGPGGTVLNVASVAGLAPVALGPVYTASKHGVVGLSRAFGVRGPLE